MLMAPNEYRLINTCDNDDASAVHYCGCITAAEFVIGQQC